LQLQFKFFASESTVSQTVSNNPGPSSRSKVTEASTISLVVRQVRRDRFTAASCWSRAHWHLSLRSSWINQASGAGCWLTTRLWRMAS